MSATYFSSYVLSTDASDAHEEARLVTIRRDDNGVATMVDRDGVDMGDPFDYRHMGVTRMRRLQEALVQADGRRTAGAVGMFAIERRHLVNRNGKLAGRWETFPERALSLLVSSDATYKGETYEDRARDFELLVTVDFAE